MRPTLIAAAFACALAVGLLVFWPAPAPPDACCVGHGLAVTTPAVAPELDGASLYQIEGVFTDQDDHPVTLASLRGGPVLVAMFYASCTTVCPMIIEELRRIRDSLPDEDRDRVRVVLVTIDPERDTPERLRALALERGIAAPTWLLLRGDDDTVRELAMALGVQYRRTPDGQFVHSALVTLLDREGAIASQLDGIDAPTAPLVARLRELVASP